MFIFLCRFAPGGLTLRSAGLEKGKKAPGEKLPALTPVSRQRRVWKKSGLLVKPMCRKRESPLQVPKTPSAFLLHGQRSAFHRRGVRQQSRSFAPQESIAETHPPTPTGFTEIVSDDFPIPYGLCWAVSLIGLSRSGGRIRTAASALSVSQSNLAG